ncbi:autotransporter outer membrane beta-barrel domain-containing protein [Suttonella sp. R2A3]|uniref:autotransporter outer membrane beta-barrel domain-containing protein n=1 Tax=Suttonella sp. R2A3 TaxID=2908648 RepID=UPI001F466A2A|nr:autotransporter outer membrane beta-barrel domain-containing protein [Suttonella sp. R2A3]UJF24704.1 autotransporter outer membrane beta-barrel domain-containing protein [Suttonella sp. R2A3]
MSKILYLSSIADCHKCYLLRYRRPLLASAIAVACLGFSATTLADTIINSDQTGNIAYGVLVNTGNAAATGGVVDIQSGGIIKRAYGGFSFYGYASDNSVTVSGGTVNEIAYGGYSQDNDTVKNSATVSGGMVQNHVYGGYSDGNGNATDNSVTVSGGTVKKSAYGGYSLRGGAVKNSVTVSGGTVDASILGAYARGDVTDNTVTVSSGTVGGNVVGGDSFHEFANNNSVIVSGGAVEGFVWGGYSIAGSANNSVTISGGEVGGGHLGDKVYGGYSVNGNASNNSVTISGGAVDVKFVYGGVSHDGDNTDNTITIKKGSTGNPTFGVNTVLYGGYNSNIYSTNEVTKGNTLNLHTTGIEVKNIANFENLHFYVQKDTANGATFLTLSDTSDTDITGSKVGIGIEGSDTVLKKGDKVVLIHKSDATGTLLTDADTPNTVTAMQGIAVGYDFTITKPDDQTLIATLSKAPTGVNPQVKSLLEARLAAVETINRGGDLANGKGMSNLIEITQDDGVKLFAVVGGDKTRTNTGSHIDVNSAHLLLGAGTGIANSSGTLMISGFAEYGKGNYDSYNDFANRPNVHASGDTQYYGLGMLAKQQFDNDWFIDAGLRVGKSKLDYFSADLVDASGTPTTFDDKSTYISANIGVGKTFAMDKKNRLTPYVNLFYTNYGSLNKKIAGSTFSFANITSLRSQLGARYQYAISEKSQVYANAAWEHEFRGTAKGKVLGFAMPEPTLKGSSGLIGAGFNLQPNENLSINLGAQGSFGNRRGVSAVGKFVYSL